MPSGLNYVDVGLTLTAAVTYGYVVYTTLLVRRTLAVGLYRRHALGIGLIAVVFVLDQVSNYFPSGGAWDYIQLGSFAAFSLVLLYWVDTSILAARRSDPLDRDTFHWSGLRTIIRPMAIMSLLSILVLEIVFGPSPDTPPPEWLNAIFVLLFFFPIYSAAISGVVVMPVAARRCKDLVFRRHLEWLFLFIAIQFVMAEVIGQLFQSGPTTGPMSIAIDGLGLLLGVMPLYQSVKRLVPLYKFAGDSYSLSAADAIGPTLVSENE